MLLRNLPNLACPKVAGEVGSRGQLEGNIFAEVASEVSPEINQPANHPAKEPTTHPRSDSQPFSKPANKPTNTLQQYKTTLDKKTRHRNEETLNKTQQDTEQNKTNLKHQET